jgi:hypothetical protein
MIRILDMMNLGSPCPFPLTGLDGTYPTHILQLLREHKPETYQPEPHSTTSVPGVDKIRNQRF